MFQVIREEFIDYDSRPTPKTDFWCIRCQKDIDKSKGKHRWVYVTEDMNSVHPDDVSRRGEREGDIGWKPIGPECVNLLGKEWTAPEPLEAIA